jgi:hypothetical protein
MHLDDAAEKRLFDYIAETLKKKAFAWTLEDNCSHFASRAWLNGTREYLNPFAGGKYKTPAGAGGINSGRKCKR